jgi:hypothetical protein
MAEPIFYRDLEFRFASGEALIVTTQDGRDTLEESTEYFRIIVGSEPPETITIDRSKLNCWRETRRTELPEAGTTVDRGASRS